MAEEIINALNENRIEDVDMILRHGANPNEVLPEQSVSPMHLAAGLGIKPVCLLLQHGGNPNVRLPDGTTPLHVSSMWGDGDCVQVLLSNGGDPFIRDQDGFSAMDFARQYEHREVVEIIKKYMYLLMTSDEPTMTPKYTYTRRSVGSDRSSVSPNEMNGHVQETSLNKCLKEFTRWRRSSIYLHSLQQQMNQCFSDGRKTHVVDVTSPDHPYIEPKYLDRSPHSDDLSPDLNRTEESLHLHLSLSDSETSTYTDSASFVTCDGEDLDTVIKMSKSELSELVTPKTVLKQPQTSYSEPKDAKSERRKKYCRRLPMLIPDTQDLYKEEESEFCEYCGCVIVNRASNNDNVCLACERLGIELEELSLDSGKNNGIKEGYTPKYEQINPNRNSNNHRELPSRDYVKDTQSDVKPSQKRTMNQNNSAKMKSSSSGNGHVNIDRSSDLDKGFVQTLDSDDSLISQDISYIHTEQRKIIKAEFHPSDISTITVSEDSQNDGFIMSGSQNYDSTNNITLKYKSDDGNGQHNAAFQQKPRNYSLNQAVVTRFSLKSDDKENKKDKSHLECSGRNEPNSAKYKSIYGYGLQKENETDKLHLECNGRNEPNTANADNPDARGVDEPKSCSPVLDDLWTEVRASAMKAKRERNTRQILDTAFIGRESMASGVSDASTIDYIYTDKENGIILLERHLPSQCGSTGSRRSLDSLFSGNNSPKETKASLNSSTSSQDTVSYNWKEHAMIKSGNDSGKGDSLPGADTISQDLLKLSEEEIRAKLKKYWDDPGPITPHTKQTYLRRLSQLQKDPNAKWITKNGPEYPPELSQALRGKLDLSDIPAVEAKMVDAFQNPNRLLRWREGTLKSSFNYLLLDPRITDNLPNRANNMDDLDIFNTFISSIFYVGKGKRARPYCHLYEAIKHMKKPGGKISRKVQQIIDIWSDGLGVVSLHCFQSVIPVEAYTREACMVDTLGLKNLTNMKRGDYYGVSTTFSMKQRRRVGVYLLTKALQIFLAEGERQISPLDLKNDP